MSSSNYFILCSIVDSTRARSAFSSAFDSVDIFLFLTARSIRISLFIHGVLGVRVEMALVG